MQRYAKWCKQHRYQARAGRAEEIYEHSQDLIAMLPKDAMTKLLVKQSVDAIILCPVLPHGAVKQGVYAGIGLV